MNAYFLATMNANLLGVKSLHSHRTSQGDAHVIKHHRDAIANTETEPHGVGVPHP